MMDLIFLIIPIVFGLVSLVCFGFWLWMLIDLIKRNQFHNFGDNAKVIWIVLLIFLGIIGAIVYFFMEKRKG